jgi:hypothetical protein
MICIDLGDLVIIVFAVRPKVRGFRPRRDERYGFLRAIKFRCTTSIGGEVKHSRTLLRHAKKNPAKYERDTS